MAKGRDETSAEALRPSPAEPAEPTPAAPLDQGPRDDFFCWTFQIWYPSEDCLYRHTNRTFPACAGCFQGRLNLTHIRKGLKPPIVLTGPGSTES